MHKTANLINETTVAIIFILILFGILIYVFTHILP